MDPFLPDFPEENGLLNLDPFPDPMEMGVASNRRMRSDPSNYRATFPPHELASSAYRFQPSGEGSHFLEPRVRLEFF